MGFWGTRRIGEWWILGRGLAFEALQGASFGSEAAAPPLRDIRVFCLFLNSEKELVTHTIDKRNRARKEGSHKMEDNASK